MCGIFGYFNREGISLNRSSLILMGNAISHRVQMIRVFLKHVVLLSGISVSQLLIFREAISLSFLTTVKLLLFRMERYIII